MKSLKKRILLLAVVLIVGGAVYTYSMVSLHFSKRTKEEMAVSKQYVDGKFVGPPMEMGIIDYVDMIRERLFGENKEIRVASFAVPRKEVDLEYYNTTGAEALDVTWLGHSSLMININGYKILTDPVFDKKVTVIGPERYNGESPFDPELLLAVDVVIISHDHYDHLNKNAVKLLAEKTKKFVVPLGVSARLIKWGIDESQIVELDWWDEYQYAPDLLLAATPASHFSGRFITDRNKTLWASWVIESKERRVFFSGDSGYFEGFKKIGQRYGPFDMTFLECGAYNKSWSSIHMFPEETVQAHIDLRGEILHPIHWGTFNLAFHPWDEPMKRFAMAAQFADVRVTMPIVGETTVLGGKLHTQAWWLPREGRAEAIERLVLKDKKSVMVD